MSLNIIQANRVTSLPQSAWLVIGVVMLTLLWTLPVLAGPASSTETTSAAPVNPAPLSNSTIASVQGPLVSTLMPLAFDNPAQEVRYHLLLEELRCPKCQNASLAGSDSPIAQDLRRKTYELVKAGHSTREVRDYMVSRYGDFISYRPPMRASTWFLWFAPPLLLVIGAIFWLLRSKSSDVASDTPLSVEEQARLQLLLGKDGEQKPSR